MIIIVYNVINLEEQNFIYKQFGTFESEVYYGIIASIIVISFVISVYKHSLKSFFTTFWSYFLALLNHFDNLPNKNLPEQILRGIWLISCTVFLAAVSGRLRTLLIKSPAIYWINSWDDLYEWKHLTIQTIHLTDLATFAKNNHDDPMALDFKSRIDLLSDEIIINKNKPLDQWFDFEGVREGRVAIVYPSHILHLLKKNLISMELKEDIDFHISEFGDPWRPFFSVYNKDKLDQKLQKKWDLV